MDNWDKIEWDRLAELAHDRAHNIERLEKEKAALLEALERIEKLTWVEDRKISESVAIEGIFHVARAAIRAAKGESNG